MSEVGKQELDADVDHLSDLKRKRNELSNARKIEVIQLAQEGKSQRQLAAEFGVSKSQVQSILQRKDDIIYRQQNEGDASVPPRKKTNFDDVNERVLDWYVQAKARGITITGAYLQQKAREIGRELGKDYFRGSNGWLEAFKKRHKGLFSEGKTSVPGPNIKENPTEVQSPVPLKSTSVTSPKTYLQNITEGFLPRDVYFACETGLLFRSLPDLGYLNNGRYNDTRANDRVTILLCTDMLGQKETAFVIGKHAKQSVFRNIDTRALPVDWSVHNRARMTGDLFLSWLRRFNDKVRKQERRILLFLEGTPVHIDVKLSNIVIRFFRETETNKVHVLHTGITQEFKMQYRIRVLRYMMARGMILNNQDSQPPESYDRITLLNAIYWISTSWDSVKFKVIQESFAAAGFPLPYLKLKDHSPVYSNPPDMGRGTAFSPYSEFSSPMNSPTQRTADFFSSKDDYIQAFSAVCQLPSDVDIHELALRYVSADDALPTYDVSEGNWDEHYFHHKRDEGSKNDMNEAYENGKETVHLCLLNSFEEVDETLRQLQDYAQENNSINVLNHIMRARDCLVDDIWRKQFPQIRVSSRDPTHDHMWKGDQPCQSMAMDYMLERASFAVSPPCETKVSPSYETVDNLLPSHPSDVR